MPRNAPSGPLMAFWITCAAIFPKTRRTDRVSRLRRSRIVGRGAEMTTSGIRSEISGRAGRGAGAGAGAGLVVGVHGINRFGVGIYGDGPGPGGAIGSTGGGGGGGGGGFSCESRTLRGIWSDGRGRSRCGGPGSRPGFAGSNDGSTSHGGSQFRSGGIGSGYGPSHGMRGPGTNSPRSLTCNAGGGPLRAFCTAYRSSSRF